MAGSGYLETQTSLPSKGINSKTWFRFEGDTPHEREIAGVTTGMIGQGHSIAHGRYMSDRGKALMYRRGVLD